MNDYIGHVYRTHTGVKKVVHSIQEEIAESDFLDHAKGSCQQEIATLERKLLYWSKPNMEFSTPINAREDIMDEIILKYRDRNELYCAKDGEYPDAAF